MSLESIGSIELLKKQKGNPYMAILSEPITLEEKLMAIYTKAIQNIGIFKPKRIPPAPAGFVAAHQDYKMADKDEQPSRWKGIVEHKDFKGYIVEIDRTAAENLSNKNFLNEMKVFFEERGITTYTEKISEALNEYALKEYEG